MPKKPLSKKGCQRKGRSGEFEIRDILRAAGWDAAVTGLYDKLDLIWWEDNDEQLCEVKRRKSILGWVYRLFHPSKKELMEGRLPAKVVFIRDDYEPWLVIMPVVDYIRKHGPTLPGKNGETPILMYRPCDDTEPVG